MIWEAMENAAVIVVRLAESAFPLAVALLQPH
jgi:hypothetical protein